MFDRIPPTTTTSNSLARKSLSLQKRQVVLFLKARQAQQMSVTSLDVLCLVLTLSMGGKCSFLNVDVTRTMFCLQLLTSSLYAISNDNKAECILAANIAESLVSYLLILTGVTPCCASLNMFQLDLVGSHLQFRLLTVLSMVKQ